MVTSEPMNARNYYYGLSTDEKPLMNVPNSSVFYEIDTKSLYMFDAENYIWISQSADSSSNTNNP